MESDFNYLYSVDHDYRNYVIERRKTLKNQLYGNQVLTREMQKNIEDIILYPHTVLEKLYNDFPSQMNRDNRILIFRDPMFRKDIENVRPVMDDEYIVTMAAFKSQDRSKEIERKHQEKIEREKREKEEEIERKLRLEELKKKEEDELKRINDLLKNEIRMPNEGEEDDVDSLEDCEIEILEYDDDYMNAIETKSSYWDSIEIKRIGHSYIDRYLARERNSMLLEDLNILNLNKDGKYPSKKHKISNKKYRRKIIRETDYTHKLIGDITIEQFESMVNDSNQITIVKFLLTNEYLKDHSRTECTRCVSEKRKYKFKWDSKSKAYINNGPNPHYSRFLKYIGCGYKLEQMYTKHKRSKNSRFVYPCIWRCQNPYCRKALSVTLDSPCAIFKGVKNLKCTLLALINVIKSQHIRRDSLEYNKHLDLRRNIDRLCTILFYTEENAYEDLDFKKYQYVYTLNSTRYKDWINDMLKMRKDDGFPIKLGRRENFNYVVETDTSLFNINHSFRDEYAKGKRVRMKESLWVLGCIEREITYEESFQLANLSQIKHQDYYKKEWLDTLKGNDEIYEKHKNVLSNVKDRSIRSNIFPTASLNDVNVDWFTKLPENMKAYNRLDIVEFRKNLENYKKRIKRKRRHVRLKLIVRNTATMVQACIFKWVEPDSIIVGDCAPQNKSLSKFRFGNHAEVRYHVELAVHNKARTFQINQEGFPFYLHSQGIERFWKYIKDLKNERKCLHRRDFELYLYNCKARFEYKKDYFNFVMKLIKKAPSMQFKKPKGTIVKLPGLLATNTSATYEIKGHETKIGHYSLQIYDHLDTINFIWQNMSDPDTLKIQTRILHADDYPNYFRYKTYINTWVNPSDFAYQTLYPSDLLLPHRFSIAKVQNISQYENLKKLKEEYGIIPVTREKKSLNNDKRDKPPPPPKDDKDKDKEYKSKDPKNFTTTSEHTEIITNRAIANTVTRESRINENKDNLLKEQSQQISELEYLLQQYENACNENRIKIQKLETIQNDLKNELSSRENLLKEAERNYNLLLNQLTEITQFVSSNSHKLDNMELEVGNRETGAYTIKRKTIPMQLDKKKKSKTQIQTGPIPMEIDKQKSNKYELIYAQILALKNEILELKRKLIDKEKERKLNIQDLNKKNDESIKSLKKEIERLENKLAKAEKIAENAELSKDSYQSKLNALTIELNNSMNKYKELVASKGNDYEKILERVSEQSKLIENLQNINQNYLKDINLNQNQITELNKAIAKLKKDLKNYSDVIVKDLQQKLEVAHGYIKKLEADRGNWIASMKSSEEFKQEKSHVSLSMNREIQMDLNAMKKSMELISSEQQIIENLTSQYEAKVLELIHAKTLIEQYSAMLFENKTELDALKKQNGQINELGTTISIYQERIELNNKEINELKTHVQYLNHEITSHKNDKHELYQQLTDLERKTKQKLKYHDEIVAGLNSTISAQLIELGQLKKLQEKLKKENKVKQNEIDSLNNDIALREKGIEDEEHNFLLQHQEYMSNLENKVKERETILIDRINELEYEVDDKRKQIQNHKRDVETLCELYNKSSKDLLQKLRNYKLDEIMPDPTKEESINEMKSNYGNTAYMVVSTLLKENESLKQNLQVLKWDYDLQISNKIDAIAVNQRYNQFINGFYYTFKDCLEPLLLREDILSNEDQAYLDEIFFKFEKSSWTLNEEAYREFQFGLNKIVGKYEHGLLVEKDKYLKTIQGMSALEEQMDSKIRYLECDIVKARSDALHQSEFYENKINGLSMQLSKYQDLNKSYVELYDKFIQLRAHANKMVSPNDYNKLKELIMYKDIHEFHQKSIIDDFKKKEIEFNEYKMETSKELELYKHRIELLSKESIEKDNVIESLRREYDLARIKSDNQYNKDIRTLRDRIGHLATDKFELQLALDDYQNKFNNELVKYKEELYKDSTNLAIALQDDKIQLKDVELYHPDIFENIIKQFNIKIELKGKQYDQLFIEFEQLTARISCGAVKLQRDVVGFRYDSTNMEMYTTHFGKDVVNYLLLPTEDHSDKKFSGIEILSWATFLWINMETYKQMNIEQISRITNKIEPEQLKNLIYVSTDGHTFTVTQGKGEDMPENIPKDKVPQLNPKQKELEFNEYLSKSTFNEDIPSKFGAKKVMTLHDLEKYEYTLAKSKGSNVSFKQPGYGSNETNPYHTTVDEFGNILNTQYKENTYDSGMFLSNDELERIKKQHNISRVRLTWSEIARTISEKGPPAVYVSDLFYLFTTLIPKLPAVSHNPAVIRMMNQFTAEILLTQESDYTKLNINHATNKLFMIIRFMNEKLYFFGDEVFDMFKRLFVCGQIVAEFSLFAKYIDRKISGIGDYTKEKRALDTIIKMGTIKASIAFLLTYIYNKALGDYQKNINYRNSIGPIGEERHVLFTRFEYTPEPNPCRTLILYNS